jgi:hypothetical protein
LEELTEGELRQVVLRGAIAFGFETDLWTVSRLRRVILDEFLVPLSKNTIWRRLGDAGLTHQKPECEYYEIDEASRKKWLRYEVPKIRRAVAKHRGILLSLPKTKSDKLGKILEADLEMLKRESVSRKPQRRRKTAVRSSFSPSAQTPSALHETSRKRTP